MDYDYGCRHGIENGGQLFGFFAFTLLALPQCCFHSLPRRYLRFQLCSPALNLLLQGSVGFTEFLFRLLSRPTFLCFCKGSLDGWYQPLLESVFQNIIFCPLGEYFYGAVFTDSTGDENKGVSGHLLFASVSAKAPLYLGRS